MTVVDFNRYRLKIWIKSKKKKFKNSYYINAIILLVFLIVFGLVTESLNRKVIYALIIFIVAIIPYKIILYLKKSNI